jgi:hypothetical protein
MKYLMMIIVLSCHTMYAQSGSNTLSESELNAAASAFTSTVKNTFATSYKIDGVTVQFMYDNGAEAVRVSNGLTNGGAKVFILTAQGGNEQVAGQYYIQYETNLCPPACDASVIPALKIDASTANKYINNFSSSKTYEQIHSFVLSKQIVNAVGTGKNLKVHNIISGSERTIAVSGWGSTSQIYVQPPTTLCPPACD